MTVICVFIDWFIPGYKAGGPIKSVYLIIDKLSRTGKFKFNVICRNTDYMENKPYANIFTDKWNYLTPFLSVYYISEHNISFFNLSKIVRAINPDVLYINGIWSLKFSIMPLFIKSDSIKKKIISPRGMLNQSAVEIKSFKKKFFLFAAKKFNIYNSFIFHFTNEDERIQSEKSIKIALNHVIIDNFAETENIYRNSCFKFENEINIVFIGRVAPEKNLLFALECLKNIENVQINFDIIGSVYNQNYFEKCNTEANTLKNNISVRFIGFLEPKLLKERLVNYHYLFLPSQGENYGHAIVESLQNGLPVIISDTTPWSEVTHNNAGFVHSLNQKELFSQTIEMLAKENNVQYIKRVGDTLSYSQIRFNDELLFTKYQELFSI